MGNIKKFNEFVNESVVEYALGGFLAIIASITILGWSYVGITDFLIPSIRNIKNKIKIKKYNKKIENILSKVEDDEELKVLLTKFKKEANSFGEEEGGSDSWVKRMGEIPLYKKIENKLKELLTENDFKEYKKICSEIGSENAVK